MQALQQKAKELLEAGAIQVVIGYGEGSNGKVRPVFIRAAADVEKLLWDDRCHPNLAVYINKPEIKKFGKAAVVAHPAAVRTIVQMIAENQIHVDSVVTLAVENNAVDVLTDKTSLEVYAQGHPVVFPPFVVKEIEDLAALSMPQKFAFWQTELEKCFKCYACRAACPLCYCERCIVECNQPQWVSVPSSAQGNFEWHMNRAIHLAGRCVSCGSCTIACPVGIPIGLLPMEASRIVQSQFGFEPGINCETSSAMSSFKNEDRETFIK
jgi:ferredoxin